MDHSAEAPHIHRSVHAIWRSTATTSNSSYLDSAHLPAINLVQCKQFARPSPRRMSRFGRREHLTSCGKEVLPILLTSTSSHGGPVQGPSPVYMEVQYRVHLCSHGGLVQGPSPVHMEVQCRAHLQFIWRSSAGPISSSHGGPVHLQFIWRSSAGPISSSHGGPVHLQFTWRPSAGPISSSHGGPVQGPSPVHMEAQCRAHLQCTWRSSPSPVHLVQGSSPVHMEAQCKAISSSHEGPMQGPSSVNMEVQCRAHLQFTWRPNAGSISSSHGGPMQGPSPVHMEAQCRVHLQFTWRPSAGSISSIRCKAHSTAGWLPARASRYHHLHPVWTPIYVGPMQTARDLRGQPTALQTLSWSGQVGVTTEDGSHNTMTPTVALREKGSTLVTNCLPRGHSSYPLWRSSSISSAQSSMHRLRAWVTFSAPLYTHA